MFIWRDSTRGRSNLYEDKVVLISYYKQIQMKISVKKDLRIIDIEGNTDGEMKEIESLWKAAQREDPESNQEVKWNIFKVVLLK